MHRASPTLLIIATCLVSSLIAAPSAAAEDSPTPQPVPSPVLLSPPAAATDPAAVGSDTPSDSPSTAPSRDGDTLVSVNVAMAAQSRPAVEVPSVTPPRARLPLRPGAYGMKVSLLQKRLAWLGYDISAGNATRQAFGASTRRAVTRFQVKNWLRPTGFVDTRTWRMLRVQSEPVGVLPRQCTEVTASLCIDKTTRTLRYVVKGTVRLATDARFGAPGMETDEGVFAVHEKSFNHVSTRFHTSMPRAMFFNGDEAVHYSPDFHAVGYAHGSHGCVGIRDLDVATELFSKVPVGTRVYVYRS